MMINKATTTSYLLQNFCISLREPEDLPYPYAIEELMGKTSHLPIIDLQSSQLGNPEWSVVGTLFAKRYSVFSMGLFSAASLFDYQLASSPGIVRFRVTHAAAMEYQTQLAVSNLLSTVDLEQRREQLIAYAKHLLQQLEQIFQSVSAHTGASIPVMWSLTSNNLQNMYARLIVNRSAWQTEERLRLIMADHAALFEPWSGNKIAMKLKPFQHPQVQGGFFYLRRHCCLAYKIKYAGMPAQEDYCSTCPKLSQSERLVILSQESGL
ncbi:(2Fe-2S)-binding protein [Cohnella abietis]|uniref:Ferric siderophore reductase C-terminal domain-containing protein n=1 Tax=Cohnella abietis TaxID=2507935 RepID=A0A3T1DEZ4_9BACL|nr:(2Fe-2S)-binding protein [Cohnella abietis]BBI36663.1 hypothetical protein KCTCHS21_60620 [Cohnella abietis]